MKFIKLFENFEDKLDRYSHYAVIKASGKILFGWEYDDIDPDELKSDKDYYFKTDIIDRDYKPSEVKIMTKNTLSKQMDINDIDNWLN